MLRSLFACLVALSICFTAQWPLLAGEESGIARVVSVKPRSGAIVVRLCESESDRKCSGEKLELGDAAGEPLNGYTHAALDGHRVSLSYTKDEEAGNSLLRIEELFLDTNELVSGFITQVSGEPDASLTFICDASHPCGKHEHITLKVTGDSLLNGLALADLVRKPITLEFQPASPINSESGTLVNLTGFRDGDHRGPFQASFFVGLGIDSFAANDLQRYLNPEASGDVRERPVAGFDFAYRLVGRPGNRQQLWVYGETVHGTRSADVDCGGQDPNSTSDDPDIPVCHEGVPISPNSALAIIRNATSLEGFLGLRYEFGTLQKGTESPARAYIKAQAGLLSITGDDNDAVDINHLGLGLLAVSGRYEGSYLEAGWGSSHYVIEHPHGRWKLDGFLTWSPRSMRRGGVGPFAQITADLDLDDGPDSIQSYFGLDFDLDYLFGGALETVRQGD